MDLHDGERLLLSTHPSWRSTLGFYLLGDVLAAAIAAVLILADRVALGIAAGAVVVLVVTVVGLVSRSATRYIVTSERIVLRRGLLGRTEERCPLSRVANLEIRQSLGQRLLGVGTVEFETAVDEPDIAFVGIDDPSAVVRSVEAALRG